MKILQRGIIAVIVFFLFLNTYYTDAKIIEKQVAKGKTITLIGIENGKWKASNHHIKISSIKKNKCYIKGMSYGTSIIKCWKNGQVHTWRVIIDEPSVKKKTYNIKEGKTLKIRIRGVHKNSKIKWKSKKKKTKVIKSKIIKRKKNKYEIDYSIKVSKYGRDTLEFIIGKKHFFIDINIKHSCKNHMKWETIKNKKEYIKKKSTCKICKKKLGIYQFNKTGIVDINQVNDKELYGNITIKNGINIIPYNFCSNNKNITGVTIPESVKEIADFAFSGCTNLQYIIIKGNSLKYIRYAAFNLCQPGLKEFPELPDSVEVIEDHAFCHTNSASFKNGIFRIPQNLKLIGKQSDYIKDSFGNYVEQSNNGFNTTHVFYDVGGKSQSPLVSFVGESTNYISIDGILYRKKSSSDKTPVYLISVPSGKKEYDQFEYDNGIKEGVYVMPNSVVAGAELCLNNYNNTMKKVVFSDSFDFSKRCNPFQCETYNVSMLYEGIPYANGFSILGGYGNINYKECDVRKTNKKYKAYKGCIYNSDYSKLWAVPPCISSVYLHDNTSKIDSGAFYQSFFGTPNNPNTGDGYEKWINDPTAKSSYSSEKKIVEFNYNKNNFKLLDKNIEDMTISEKIVYHTVKNILKNNNSKYNIHFR